MKKQATSAPGKLAFKLYPDILKEFQKRTKKEIIAVNFASHAELMGSKTKKVSADFPCYMIEEIEEKIAELTQEKTNLVSHQDYESAAIVRDKVIDGIADLHCRSDKYLAEEVWNEHLTSVK